jgi:hypothetical protein
MQSVRGDMTDRTWTLLPALPHAHLAVLHSRSLLEYSRFREPFQQFYVPPGIMISWRITAWCTSLQDRSLRSAGQPPFQRPCCRPGPCVIPWKSAGRQLYCLKCISILTAAGKVVSASICARWEYSGKKTGLCTRGTAISAAPVSNATSSAHITPSARGGFSRHKRG